MLELLEFSKYGIIKVQITTIITIIMTGLLAFKHFWTKINSCSNRVQLLLFDLTCI